MVSLAGLAFTVLVWLAKGRQRKGPLEVGSAGLTVALIAATVIAWMSPPPVDDQTAEGMRVALPRYAAIAVSATITLWLVSWLARGGFQTIFSITRVPRPDASASKRESTTPSPAGAGDGRAASVPSQPAMDHRREEAS